MPNLKAKYIIDENGDRVAPITYIDAVRNSSGDSLSDLMVPENLGFGIGTCSTSSGTALTVTLQGYKLVKNSYVTITFENDVPASSTLNINSQGAKAIYYNGAAIQSGVIKADDTITFCYDGTNYEVISLGGGGSAAGLEIVAASGTTLNAEVGKYYRFDSNITSLTVNLPTITGATEVQKIMLFFSTNINISLTLSSTDSIRYINEHDIKGGYTYEMSMIWNGDSWTVTTLTKEALPYGAIPIKYLQSSGTQYIDTGIIPSSTIDITGNYCNNGSTGSYGFWGTYDSYYVLEHQNYGVFTKTSSYVEYTLGNDFADITFAGNTLFVNGSQVGTVERGTGSTSYTIPIFCLRVHGNIGWFSSMKLSFFKIYNGSNVVRDFIPVRVGQTGYLYDKVSKTLFGNNGTGDFIIGPDY